MSEVKVETGTSLARREAPELSLSNDFFAPMFPVGRLFGMSPFGMMREFSDDMERMFRAGGPSAEGSSEQMWAPKVDVQRVDGQLLVTAELPGLKKEEVKVEMTDDALVIEGERKREHKEDHKGFHRYERSYGKFYRSIPLPEGVRMEQVKAELNDGVLKVSVPMAEAKKIVHPIAVQTGSEKKPAAA